MLADDEENLEEIEALLYAQVYHESAAENQLETKDSLTSVVNAENGPITIRKQSFRYFDESNKLIFYEDKDPCLGNIEESIPNNNPVITETESNTAQTLIPSTTEAEVTPPGPSLITSTFTKVTSIPSSSSTTTETTLPVPTLNGPAHTTVPSLPLFVPLTNTVTTSNRTEELPQFVVNIIRNHTYLSPDITQHLLVTDNWPIPLRNQFTKYKTGQIIKWKFVKDLKFEIRKHLRLRHKEIRKHQRALERGNRERQLIVFLSSDSETENINSNSKTMPNSTSTKKSSKKNNNSPTINVIEESESDDDAIIYIAPPPVPVVSVDTDSDEHEAEEGRQKDNMEENVEKPNLENEQEQSPTANEEKTRRKKKKNKSVESEPVLADVSSFSVLVEEEASNDFLSNEPTESQADNFNFALHGSDFNSTDFVRPANPTEFYETESSTSTSDFNRDSSRNYSNSVKTIVFNEVEFPKEDIFTNNLEGFEELITTKETLAKKKKKAVKSKGQETPKSSKKAVVAKEDEGSDSSSESDYEQTFSNLPNLSPMVKTSSPKKAEKNTPKSTKKKNKRTSEKPIEALEEKSTRKKKKSRSMGPEMTDNQTEEVECAAVVETTPSAQKRKSKSVTAETLDKQVDGATDQGPDGGIQETVQKKAKKRKKKSGNKIAEETEEVVEASVVVQEMDDDLKSFYKEIDGQVEDEPTPQTKKKKKNNKKKKKLSNTIQETAEKDASVILVNTSVQIDDENVKDKQKDDKTKGKNNNNIEENNDKTSNHIEDDEEVILIDNTPAPIEIQDSDEDDSEKEDNGPPVDTRDLLLANASGTTNKKEDTTNKKEENVEIQKRADQSVDRDYSEFDVSNLQANMSDDPSLWRISIHDRVQERSKKKGPRCNRCKQFGHFAIRCPNKPSQPSCQLCAEVGHEEPRCPNKICFSCGNEGNFSTVYCWKCVKNRNYECDLCKCVGHLTKNCPDLWRRYHLTTTPGPLIKPKPGPQLRPEVERWCSGCATKGHLDYECNSYKYIRQYPAAVPMVKDYSCVYGEDKIPRKPPDEASTSKQDNTVEDAREYNNIQVVTKQKTPNSSCNLESKKSSKPTVKEQLLPNKPSENQFNPPSSNNRFSESSHTYTPSNQNMFNINNEILNQLASFRTQPVLNVIAPLANNIVANQISTFFNNSGNNSVAQPMSSFLNNSVPQHLMPNPMNFIQNDQIFVPPNSDPSSYPMPPNTLYNIPVRNNFYPSQYDVLPNNYPMFETHNQAPPNFNHNRDAFNNNQYVDKFQDAKGKFLEKFRDTPIKDLHEFVQDELKKLESMIPNANHYRKKLHTIDHLSKKPPEKFITKQKDFHYKSVNMFLFGVKQLRDGKRHLDCLQQFVYQPGTYLKPSRRRQLHEAYIYIFGGRHSDVNYKMLINNLVVGNRSGCRFE